MKETGTTSSTFAANLFMSKNSGAYAQVNASTANAKVVDSANYVDNANTTQQLSSGTFVAGRLEDVDGTTGATSSIAQNSVTDFEFMFQLVSADLAHGDTLDFRCYKSGVAVATYTNTARITITKNHIVTVNQITETDTAQPIGRVKQEAIGQNTETDLAQTLTRRKVRTVNQASETDTPQAILGRKLHALAQVTEANLAQPVTRQSILHVAVTQVTETESAQTITTRKFKVLAQTSETDLAQPATRQKIKALGQTLETDLAQSMSKRKIKSVLQVVEINISQTILRKTGTLMGQAEELDLTQALFSRKRISVGQAAEFDSAQAFLTSKRFTIAQVIEIDLAQPIQYQLHVNIVLRSSHIARTSTRTIYQTETRVAYPVRPADYQTDAKSTGRTQNKESDQL